jgi:phage gp46-like protein
MTDIRIVNQASLAGIWADYLFAKGRLDESNELMTAVTVALLTDSLADANDVLPDPDSTDRRGWWGDTDADIWEGWPIGCKNWLLLRAKITDANSFEGATVVRAEMYTRQALQPFIDKKICSRVDVTATRTDDQQIDVTVVIYRGPLVEIELRFQNLWTGIGG